MHAYACTHTYWSAISLHVSSAKDAVKAQEAARAKEAEAQGQKFYRVWGINTII